MIEPSPILRWAGSKRNSLQYLKTLWRRSGKTHYIEPFCGSAALFFSINPQTAVLSDQNRWLIQTLNATAHNPDEVHEISSGIPRTKEEYYKVRERDPLELEETTSAAHFIYLNRNCFNGIFRTNKLGRFNVPYSNSRTGAHPSKEAFRAAAKVLRKASILASDFEETVENYVTRNSFVYLDPPYATKNSRIFTQYDSHSFGIDDIDRLERLTEIMEERGAHFVISYADVPEINKLSHMWNCQRRSVRRYVASNAEKRKIVDELTIHNIN